MYNKNFLKTKITFYGDEITDFYGKEVPKVDSNHTCLAVISLGSALRKNENYYLSANALKKVIIGDPENSSVDFDFSKEE